MRMRVDNLLEIFPPGVYPLVGYGQEYGLVPGLKFSLGGGGNLRGKSPGGLSRGLLVQRLRRTVTTAPK